MVPTRCESGQRMPSLLVVLVTLDSKKMFTFKGYFNFKKYIFKIERSKDEIINVKKKIGFSIRFNSFAINFNFKLFVFALKF